MDAATGTERQLPLTLHVLGIDQGKIGVALVDAVKRQMWRPSPLYLRVDSMSRFLNVNYQLIGDNMENLISKLSKIDQRNIRMALIHARNGNMRPLEFMLRASNTRSEKIIKAIIDSVK